VPETHKLRKISKEAVWIFSGQAVAIALQLLALRLLTDALSVSEYGVLSLLLVSATLIERTLMVVQAGVGRYYLEAVQENKVKPYWFASMQILLRSSVLSLLVGLIIILVASLLLPFNYQLPAVFILIAAIMSGWNAAFSGIILSARKRSSHALFQVIDFSCRLAFIFLFTSLLGLSLLGVSLAYMLAASFLLVLQHRSVIKLLGLTYNSSNEMSFKTDSLNSADWRHQIWTYSAPFFAWGGFSWMQQSSDRFALETFAGSPAVGFYSVIFQLGYTPMTILGTMTITLIQPILFSRALPKASPSKNDHSLIQIPLASSVILLLISAILALTAYKYHHSIFLIFVAEDFRSYSQLLPYAVLAGGVFAAAQPLGARLMATKNTIQIFWINTAFSFISIFFNFLGAYYYGIPGVVAALLISALCYWMLFILALNNLERRAILFRWF